jgi:ankyrin repeat protein
LAEAQRAIDYDANVFATDNHGCTVLHYDRNAATAVVLLEHDAKVNARADTASTQGTRESKTAPLRDYTPLHIAALNYETGVVAVLLGHGADVNAKDDRGLTALAIAQSLHDKAVVELLKKHGATE